MKPALISIRSHNPGSPCVIGTTTAEIRIDHRMTKHHESCRLHCGTVGLQQARLVPQGERLRALPMEPSRLNLGCGPKHKVGWINVDRLALPGVDVLGDVLAGGLPFAGRTFDMAVAMHVLQDMPWAAIPVALAELQRVLKPGGVLRLGLPDLDRAMAAYQRGDSAYFHIPDDDARHIGSKLVTQIIWYGSVRTPFTFGFAEELLGRARFANVQRCSFGLTASRHPEIVDFDNRPRETMFIEAVKA